MLAEHFAQMRAAGKSMVEGNLADGACPLQRVGQCVGTFLQPAAQNVARQSFRPVSEQHVQGARGLFESRTDGDRAQSSALESVGPTASAPGPLHSAQTPEANCDTIRTRLS